MTTLDNFILLIHTIIKSNITMGSAPSKQNDVVTINENFSNNGEKINHNNIIMIITLLVILFLILKIHKYYKNYVQKKVQQIATV